MILFVEEDGMCIMAGAGDGYEQSSSEIRHTGKSFFDAWYTGSGAQPYLERIRIGHVERAGSKEEPTSPTRNRGGFAWSRHTTCRQLAKSMSGAP